MNHVGTICTHCGDGCKTTLGVRRADTGMEIVRGDNRDKSGINGDFLCIKGRYAFDFADHTERLRQPMIRKDGKLKLATWEEAFQTIGAKFREVKESGRGFGVIGSNRTTNEENYLLQKFARTVLGTNHIDHHRTADYPAFARAVAGKPELVGSLRDTANAPAILLIGNDPTNQHPLLAVNIRNNVRLYGGRLYIVNHDTIKLKRQAKAYAQIPEHGYSAFLEYLGGNDAAGSSLGKDVQTLREALRKEENIVIAFGSELRGEDIVTLAKLAASHKSAKLLCLGDYANSRGAADMGLYPDLLPGYTPVTSAARGAVGSEYAGIPTKAGMNIDRMVAAAKRGELGAMYIVGSNALGHMGVQAGELQNCFTVVQEMFLTETASLADVVLPAANAYEKSGTVTNTYGDLQQLKQAGDFVPAKSDFELIVRIADRMGADVTKLVPFGRGTRADLGQSRGAQSGEADRHGVWLANKNIEPKTSPFDPFAILDEIQRVVPGYDFSRLNLFAGNDVHTTAIGHGAGAAHAADEVHPANDTLFTSGTLGRYSNTLNSVMERYKESPAGEVVAGD
jgi:NADH-quinone oxidoreductase subunit G